jgi:hypothetical protein
VRKKSADEIHLKECCKPGERCLSYSFSTPDGSGKTALPRKKLGDRTWTRARFLYTLWKIPRAIRSKFLPQVIKLKQDT